VGLVTELEAKGARVCVRELPGQRRRVEVTATDPNISILRSECETSYPASLIKAILEAKDPSNLCDEVARDEEPQYILHDIEDELFAYFRKEEFRGKRILDFGCGCGASTRRVSFYGLEKVQFHLSASPTELPAGIGQFDFIILSAVFEHLLPRERRELVPRLWDAVKPGGYLFLNQTPHRYFPIEVHTTGLPLLNYFSDKLTLSAARALSKRVQSDEQWESLLRRGIRGGTETEVHKILGHSAVELDPIYRGRDRIDLWYSRQSPRYRLAKIVIKATLKLLKRISGTVLVPYLALAYKKDPASA
jgi:2-polyprenyl-3-methyl-5-hydroxy-6-metoxy-1,4-benzoquinol methylase